MLPLATAAGGPRPGPAAADGRTRRRRLQRGPRDLQGLPPRRLRDLARTGRTRAPLDALPAQSRKDPRCLSCHSPEAEKVSRRSPARPATARAAIYSAPYVMRDAELARLVGLVDPGEKSCLACHGESAPSLVRFEYMKKLPLIDHWTPRAQRRRRPPARRPPRPRGSDVPVQVVSAEFATTATRRQEWPQGGDRRSSPSWARSNVGKSSMLNALTRRKGLARVSNTPGRTRALQFFDVSYRPSPAVAAAGAPVLRPARLRVRQGLQGRARPLGGDDRGLPARPGPAARGGAHRRRAPPARGERCRGGGVPPRRGAEGGGGGHQDGQAATDAAGRGAAQAEQALELARARRSRSRRWRGRARTRCGSAWRPWPRRRPPRLPSRARRRAAPRRRPPP